jgi:glutaredoxin
MKTVELFHLPGCPYCVKAGKAIDELVARNPAYGSIEVKWIDESMCRDHR